MPMHELVLAIDFGSSWCKTAYVDRQGNLVALGRSYTRDILSVRNGLLEQSWQALVAAVRAANHRLLHPARPTAIALSCRALFGICIDHSGHPHLPAWDANLTKTSPAIRQAYSPEIWGNQDPYAYGYGIRLAGTARWLQQERPDEWRRIARIGALHDFLVYQMTDAWVTDPTTGPGPTGWPDVITAVSGLSLHAFPRTLPPHAVAGTLVPDAANALGLPERTPVVVGMHDGAAANWGVRALRAGDACLTLGTNFVFRASTGERLTTGCFSYCIAPGAWTWVNNVPSSSTQLDIVAESLLEDIPDMSERHRRLGLLADKVAPGADGLIIRRILPGQEEALRAQVREKQRAGYPDGAIYRAMLEAIAFGVRNLVNTAMNDGVDPKRFVATGGSAQNESFVKVLAAVLHTPIEVGEPEAGLVGAAMAAAIGSNWYGSIDEATAAMTSLHSIIYPDAEAVQYYARVDSSVAGSPQNMTEPLRGSS